MWGNWTRPVTIIAEDATSFFCFEHFLAGRAFEESHADILVERYFCFCFAEGTDNIASE